MPSLLGSMRFLFVLVMDFPALPWSTEFVIGFRTRSVAKHIVVQFWLWMYSTNVSPAPKNAIPHPCFFRYFSNSERIWGNRSGLHKGSPPTTAILFLTL